MDVFKLFIVGLTKSSNAYKNKTIKGELPQH